MNDAEGANVNKKVCFDNSFLSNHKEKALNYINTYFPQDEYLRIVPYDVALEYFYKYMENKDAWHCWEKFGFHMFDDNDIVFYEYIFGPEWENFQLRDFVNDFSNMTIQKRKELEGAHEQRRKDDENRFCSINTSNSSMNPIAIKNNLIWNKVQNICNNPDYRNESIKNVLKVVGNNCSTNGFQLELKQDFKVKEITNIKESLPTFYNLFVFDAFKECLEKPKSFEKRSEKNKVNRGFNFKPEDPENRVEWIQKPTKGPKLIEIEKNTFADARIAMYFLHYVDKFVTCDLNQAELLIFLYPHYKSKIVFK